ncbi:MAG: NADH-quinone oxidoreductase subunit NuoF, partial [Planctomycetaceae bacterium]|nr:NADH-quinone oxidoreductase subunit NuoF [Planctomycetaceae bacterium]
MAEFEPVLSRNWNVPDSHSLKVAESRGAYQAARKALTTMDPDKVVQIVKDSELRGRGGAGFPCGLKWSFLPKDRKETLMCINADESEPATFNNRILMEKDPHQFLEGILISCFATKASTAYIYIRVEYFHAYKVLEAAIAEAREVGHLGKNIYGVGFDLDVWVHRGAGAYICGEETGLIESLEGKRGWPRIKPPFPAIEGAFRKPTVVNNVETLSCVPFIVERGADWFKSLGTPKSYGPKLYTVSGHVNKQVCVELPLGVTCRELIDVHALGVWKGRKAKAAVPGGISMGLLSAEELDTPLDFESLRKPGCLGLGTAAVTVIDDHTSIVDYLYNTARFFAHESCGQCTPCREGTAWMYKTIQRIRRGGGRIEDLDILLQMAN